MSTSPGLVAFKLAFQLSPIILTNGIAGPIPGGMLPIIALTEAAHFTLGLLNGANNINLDNFFANFAPMPGATLIDNQIGNYPFANQAVAANAIIANPLAISMRMMVPVRDPGGYAIKLATMTALQATLAKHSGSGGTYIVATPSYFYTNCILTKLTDVSNNDSKQAQNAWQFDFAKPLLTLADAEQAQNSLISRITSSTAIPGVPGWSGLTPAVGNPASVTGPSLIPSSTTSSGAGIPADAS